MNEQSEVKLEPCPFCGRRMIRSGLDQPHWQQWWEHEDRETSQCVLKNQTISDTSNVYKAAWNSRAPVVAPQGDARLVDREAAARVAFDAVMATPVDGESCRHCNGAGKVLFMPTLMVECKYCNGTGIRPATTPPAVTEAGEQEQHASARAAAREWLHSEREAFYAAAKIQPPSALMPQMQKREDEAVERLTAVIIRHCLPPPSTSEAIRAAAEEIADMVGFDVNVKDASGRTAVAILSRWFGKGETDATQTAEGKGDNNLEHPLIVRGHYHVDTFGHIAKRRCSCSLNAPPHRFVCAVCVEPERITAAPASPSPAEPLFVVHEPTNVVYCNDSRCPVGATIEGWPHSFDAEECIYHSTVAAALRASVGEESK